MFPGVLWWTFFMFYKLILISINFITEKNKYLDLSKISNLTCSSTRPQRSRLWGRVHPSKHRHPLRGGAVEVIVVRNGGDPKAGVVLRRGVGAIAVARMVREAGLPVVGEFRCFFILTLDTAHSLLSAGGGRRWMELAPNSSSKVIPYGETLTPFISSHFPLRVKHLSIRPELNRHF